MTRYSAIIATLTGSCLVAYAFKLLGMPWLAFVLIVYCICWTIGNNRQMNWIYSLGLALSLSLAVVALYFRGDTILVYSGVFLSLVGWDMADLSIRLKYSSPDDDVKSIQTTHFRRIVLLMSVSLVLVICALNIHAQLSMGLLALISLSGAIGLGIIVQYLNRE